MGWMNICHHKFYLKTVFANLLYPKCKVWVEWYVREVREDGGQLLNQSLSLLTPATISEDFFIMFSNNK